MSKTVTPKKGARILHTQCILEQLEFQGLGNRKVVTDFSGGRITSDAGGLLLREVEKGTGILRGFADCFVDSFLDAYRKPRERVILDFDATDDPFHGEREGRFFHGYYGCYCYLPLYVFSDDHLLCARLRPSNIDAAKGSLEELERIVGQIRDRWPDVQIIVRPL